jgi:diguanylate cyclase (GGDEF)-like protein
MDIFTLLICTAMISLSMVITVFVLYITTPRESYLVEWIVAGLCFFLSNGGGLLLSLLAERHQFIAIAANSFYMAGHAAVLSGISTLLLNKNLRTLVFVTFVITVGLHQSDFVMSSVENRILTFYPLAIAITIGSAVMLLMNYKQREDRRALFILLFTVSFFALQLIVRFPLLLDNELNMKLVGNDFMQTSGTLFLMLYLFLLTISFSFIVVWRKEIQLRKFAFIDDLSGLLNRKSLNKRASEEMNRSKREGLELSFIMIDIDHFKKVNDQFGHLVGDAAIQHVCRLVEKCKRDHDLSFRVGGEEFLIITPNTSSEEAQSLAERIRALIDSTPLVFQDKSVLLTVSIGVASTMAELEGWKILYDNADAALYLSKENGRNRVTCSETSSVSFA